MIAGKPINSFAHERAMIEEKPIASIQYILAGYALVFIFCLTMHMLTRGWLNQIGIRYE